MNKCDRCGKYFKYTRNGMCKECFWSKHINDCDVAESTAEFFEQYDNCYGDLESNNE